MVVELDKTTHTYTVNGVKKPSCSELLDLIGGGSSVNFVPKERLQMGTNFHNISLYIDAGIAWKDVPSDVRAKILASDEMSDMWKHWKTDREGFSYFFDEKYNSKYEVSEYCQSIGFCFTADRQFSLIKNAVVCEGTPDLVVLDLKSGDLTARCKKQLLTYAIGITDGDVCEWDDGRVQLWNYSLKKRAFQEYPVTKIDFIKQFSELKEAVRKISSESNIELSDYRHDLQQFVNLANSLKLVNVSDEASRKLGNEKVGFVKKHLKRIDEVRQKYTKPLLDKKKEVDFAFKEITDIFKGFKQEQISNLESYLVQLRKQEEKRAQKTFAETRIKKADPPLPPPEAKKADPPLPPPEAKKAINAIEFRIDFETSKLIEVCKGVVDGKYPLSVLKIDKVAFNKWFKLKQIDSEETLNREILNGNLPGLMFEEKLNERRRMS